MGLIVIGVALYELQFAVGLRQALAFAFALVCGSAMIYKSAVSHSIVRIFHSSGNSTTSIIFRR